MTKVTVISGFLGAGKTTLIKKLLEEAFKGEKVVLIENEFGEIGIDGGFMKEAGVMVSEMNSGCICCTLVGDFSEALGQVLSTYAPDRVIIEPSGVGKLSDVIRAVKGVSHDMPLELTSSVTVVDGMKCKMYSKNFGEFYNNQVENAATIVMSRTQNMTEEKLKESVHLLRSKNSKASIITTPWEDLRGEQILAAMEQGKTLAQELMEEYLKEEHHDHCDGDCGCEHHEHHSHGEEGECCCHHEQHDHHHNHCHDEGEKCCCHHHGHHKHHHHHHADEVFSDWGVETFEKYSKEELETILNALANTSSYGNVLRSKGMVQGKDKGWFYFDLVPNEYEIREGSPDVTGRICVIGTELHKDKIAQLFHI
ncbi:GTP-binding protein [Alloiococcus sp. CFN-8]|uniref:GTP-binding protein n=1 Tax=Alloiococcus sp. CFN-8 TaxID=3416081 RepID=UPI003CED731B